MRSGLHNIHDQTHGGLTYRQRAGRPRQDAAARLAARTTKVQDGCWIVSGHALRSGHVQIASGSVRAGDFVRVRAHRLAWELANGQIPNGLSVLHRCDNPRCVNPNHLFLGTQTDNVLDCVVKERRQAFGRQKLQVSDVCEIRALAASGWTHAAIAARFGVRRHTVTGIVNGHSWRNLPEQVTDDQPVQSQDRLRLFDGSHGPFELVPAIPIRVAGEVR